MLKLRKKLSFLTIFWILFYFLVFGLLLRSSFSYLDPDLGWHLKVGEEIAVTHVLPHVNHFNYTYAGRWVDHEWLANLISFEIFKNFNYLGLNIFYAGLILAVLILLNINTRKLFKKTPDFLIAFLQIIGLIACLPSFGLRTQEFGLFFLLLELLVIQKFENTKNWRYLILFCPLFYLWANIHGSFLMGLGLLLGWLMVKVAQLIISHSKWHDYFTNDETLKIFHLKIFAAFSLGALICTAITPYGLELYSFLGTYSNTFYLKVIQEWQSQANFPFCYPQLLYLAMVLFTVFLFFKEIVLNKIKKINLWQLSLSILFLYMGFRSRRHFPLMFVASFAFLTETLSDLFSADSLKLIRIKKFIRVFLLLCLALSGLNQYVNISYTQNPFTANCNNYPCSATVFLQREAQYSNFNLLNDYNWGGYLIWTYPKRKLFIDGRIPQTIFAGHTFLEEYYDFYNQKKNIGDKLNQYNIRLVLIKTKDAKITPKKWEKIIFWINEADLISPNYLRRYLDSSSSWIKIYSDSVATIYFKK